MASRAGPSTPAQTPLKQQPPRLKAAAPTISIIPEGDGEDIITQGAPGDAASDDGSLLAEEDLILKLHGVTYADSNTVLRSIARADSDDPASSAAKRLKQITGESCVPVLTKNNWRD